MNLFIYLLLNYFCYFFLSIKLLFLMSSTICRSTKNIKYCTKHHITSFEHCVSCKLSFAFSLYSLKEFYLDDRCDRVRESASFYLILMFCSCYLPYPCLKFVDGRYYIQTVTSMALLTNRLTFL